MNLEPIAKRIVDKRLGVKGKTLFIMNMPAETRNAILLRDSDFVGTPIDHELKGYRRGKFQLIVRCDDYAAGALLIDKVTDALTIEVATLLGGVQMNRCRARNEAVSYPLSVANNYEFSVNFDAVYVIV